jgi:hypothetical protein
MKVRFLAAIGAALTFIAGCARPNVGADNLRKLVAAYETDEKQAQSDYAETWLVVTGTVTEVNPAEGDDTFPWLVLDGKVSCLFDEGAACSRITLKGSEIVGSRGLDDQHPPDGLDSLFRRVEHLT